MTNDKNSALGVVDVLANSLFFFKSEIEHSATNTF